MPRDSVQQWGPAQYFVEFSLRNACVSFYGDHFSQFRASFVSLDDRIEGMVHGFSEYTYGYQRLVAIHPAAPQERARLVATCPRRAHGIGVPFSCNNIYHQSFHAIPAWERWHAREGTADAGFGDDTVDFVPLVYPTAAVGKKMSADPQRWHAWEFSLRPYTSRRYEDDLARRTSELLHARCTCYDRFDGNALAFNPIARSAAPRLRNFREASLRHLPPPSPHLAAAATITSATVSGGTTGTRRAGEGMQVLWVVRRHALRNIANEARLASRFAREPALATRVRRVVLEALPLAEQMQLVARSGALLAVHGQAMAWVLFLPSGARTRSAAVEIFPPGLVNPIYRELSLTLGVRYEELRARAADGCVPTAGTAGKLLCNVTVSVEKVIAATARAAEWTA